MLNLRMAETKITKDVSFAIMEGTFPEQEGFSEFVYNPEGFTSTNSKVVAFDVLYNGTNWRTGYGISDQQNTRCFLQLYSNGIRAYTNITVLLGQSFRVLLCKHS